MRKLSARWVSRLLTVDQKRVGMNISNALLAQFKRNKSEFWRRLITVDETWVHHYTPERFFLKKRGNHLLLQRETPRTIWTSYRDGSIAGRSV